MTASKSLTRSLVAAALLAAGTAQAQIVMYTDHAAWQAALAQTGFDYFWDLSPGPQGVPNLNRQTFGGEFSYTVSAQGNGQADELFVAGTQTDHWISSQRPDSGIFLHGFSQGVTAVSVNGVPSDLAGAPAPGFRMNVEACPIDVNAACMGDSYIATIGASDFRGFIAPGGLRYVQVWSDASAFPSISAVHIGVVPEPGTYALMLAGLASVGLLVHRRRAA
jgi:PEP-CTERM motif